MAKVRINYTEFKNAGKTTMYSLVTSIVGYMVILFSGLLCLFSVGVAIDGDLSGIIGCLLGGGIIGGYALLYSRVIYPWLCKSAEKERATLAESLRKTYHYRR